MVRLKEELNGGGELVVERRTDGQLWARQGGKERAIRLHRCFPWSAPEKYLSLRDVDGGEFALVGSLDEVGDASRGVLEGAVAEAGFVLRVTGILEVVEEVEIRTWAVETEQGARTFQTKLDDWPAEVPGGGIVIRDVAGDLYHVADPTALDDRSRKWLWAFVD